MYEDSVPKCDHCKKPLCYTPKGVGEISIAVYPVVWTTEQERWCFHCIKKEVLKERRNENDQP